MLKIIKVCCCLILLILLIYSFFNYNPMFFSCVQLIFVALFIYFGIDSFKKKQRYHGALYFIIAGCNFYLNIGNVI
ncbi:hypothetical protein ABD75_04610 [Bacillus vallismortis]|nr:hypothetical protein [Bacillus vallismortis]QAV08621.1 hypothetical protein BV11031_08455 [Bacillus vallismortis]